MNYRCLSSCSSALVKRFLQPSCFAVKKTIYMQAHSLTSKRVSKRIVYAENRQERRDSQNIKRQTDLSLSALRIIKAQNIAELQHQREKNNNELKLFSENLNKLVDKMDETSASISEDLAEDNLGYSEADNEPLEFITISDTDPESSKRKCSHILGSEDHSVEPSNIPCSGCGAHLQCHNRTLPGFMASEYYKLLTEEELKGSICQRCFLMQQRNLFSEVSTTPAEYAEMISKIRLTRSVVVMVVDVMDIEGSIIPHLLDYIGYKHPLVIVGNKADLLAPDNSDYLKTVQAYLKKSCKKAGLRNVQKCMLVSAKTGFGIERLINSLFSFYKKRVDVYIVGTANAGKSSLFNMLLGSDYCKHTARDLIQRATVSVWPGTTLNLLKFPIMRPSFRTMFLRHRRLSQKKALAREEAKLKSERSLNPKEKTWELKDDVEMTDVRTDLQRADDETGEAWGQSVVSFQGSEDGSIEPMSTDRETTVIDKEDFSDSYWMHDTPGIINPNQVMNLLTPEENSLLAPESMIIPRTAVLHPLQTLFISGLARLDYIKGEEPVFIAIHSSLQLPVFIRPYEEANEFYQANIGTELLGVPLGDKERLWKLPSLIGREYTVEGLEAEFAAADIQFSSIGWVSIAPRKHREVKIQAYTPGGKGLHLRTPALLPAFTQFRGKRISGTQFYRTKNPGSAMIGKELSIPSNDL